MSCRNTFPRTRPLNFDERAGHFLPPTRNPLQWFVRDIKAYSRENNIQLNKQKTKAITFSRARKWAFPFELTFNDGTPFESMSETTLLGVVVTNYLKWAKNTSFINHLSTSQEETLGN